MKTILILLALLSSSCASIKLNGVEVKRSHRKPVQGKDVAVCIGLVVTGVYISNNVTIYKNKP